LPRSNGGIGGVYFASFGSARENGKAGSATGSGSNVSHTSIRMALFPSGPMCPTSIDGARPIWIASLRWCLHGFARERILLSLDFTD
jgi:hypothetical protein